MRILSTTFIVLFGLLASAQTKFIHVDQFGYPTHSPKVAVISNPQVGFNANDNYAPSTILNVVDTLTNAVVYSDTISSWSNGATDTYSGDQGWWFDFSSITAPGTYYIEDAATGERSHVFDIGANVYGEVLQAATRVFYYSRSSSEKSATHAGANWADNMDFNNPQQDHECRFINDPTNTALEKDLSGGWYDAGDYNKFVPVTESVIHNLIAAYKRNPNLFGDDWNIPESGNGTADILDELKWELDWLMKMTNPDGSAHIKMGNQNYVENTQSPPSANTDPRFYGPTCTSASAVIASTLSHAALLFDTIPGHQAYAAQLQTEAINAFNYVLPFANNLTLETDCDDGSIVSGDGDLTAERQIDAMTTAAAYLFELTGDQVYHDFFIANSITREPVFNDYWDAYRMPLQDALLHYRTLPNADPAIAAEITTSISTAVIFNWNNYYGMNDLTLYRDYVPEWAYHWGSNGGKSGFGILNLLVADHQVNLSVESQRNKAKEILHSLHGVNPLDVVYLTNMYSFGAEHSVNQIFHMWFHDQTDYDHALNSLYGPPPGFIPGGPNRSFSVATITPPYDQPSTKSYLDYNDPWPNNSWEVNEPAIAFQAAYIRLLSEVMGLTNDANVSVESIGAHQQLMVSPNPCNDYLEIQGLQQPQSIQVYDLSGQIVLDIETSEKIQTSQLKPGIYLLKFDSPKYTPIKFVKR